MTTKLTGSKKTTSLSKPNSSTKVVKGTYTKSKLVKKTPKVTPRNGDHKKLTTITNFAIKHKKTLLKTLGIAAGLSLLAVQKVKRDKLIESYNQHYNEYKSFEKELKELNFAEPNRIFYDPKIKQKWRTNLLSISEYITDFFPKHYNAYYDPNLLDINVFENKIELRDNESDDYDIRYDLTNETAYLPILVRSFKKGIKSKKRFQIIQVGLYHKYEYMCGHANALVIDHKNKHIDLFEPQGNILRSRLSGESKKLMKILKLFNHIGYSVSDFGGITTMGLQRYDKYCKSELYSMGGKGYCVAWSVFFMEMKLANPDVSLKQLVKKYKTVVGTDHCRFIWAYGYYIDEFYYTVFKRQN